MNTPERRREATARFHERTARILREHGDEENAAAAERMAERTREAPATAFDPNRFYPTDRS